MADLLDDYEANGWDEMLSPTGSPRPAYRALAEVLGRLSSQELAQREQARDRAFTEQGITFSLSGQERPFPLDLIPRVISGEEWAVIEAGVGQRVRALEAFLDDVYGRGSILDEGVVPRHLVTSSANFHRAAAGVAAPNGVRCHVAGIDLARGGDGRFYVIEDNLRTPSGISYVIENRRTLARVFPQLFASQRVRPVDSYPTRLLEGLRAAAPAGVADPTVVVLTPGVYNSAYFEHVFLARQMGVELVEGRDLVCRDNVVYMRSTGGDQRVDVVYRRVDDDYLDPLHFRGDSVVGCAGILNSARAGNVTIANGVGSGVADDKLTYTYVPAMIEYYLGEAPILPNVTTYRLEDPDVLAHVTARLDELVVKPVSGSGGYGLVIGPQAGDEELERTRAAILARPRDFIAQEVVALSTVPTYVGDRLVARHVDLRPFAVNDGTDVWVAPGGLTRVALAEGSLVVNSSQGGGSKDTWVLARDGAAGGDRSNAWWRPETAMAPPVAPEAGTFLGQASQAQQQQQEGEGEESRAEPHR